MRTVQVVGFGFAAFVLILGSYFIWLAYFDPSVPYLPEGSDALVLFVTGAMGAAIQFVFGQVASAQGARHALDQPDRSVDPGPQPEGPPP